jgi:hypothetical protein
VVVIALADVVGLVLLRVVLFMGVVVVVIVIVDVVGLGLTRHESPEHDITPLGQFSVHELIRPGNCDEYNDRALLILGKPVMLLINEGK